MVQENTYVNKWDTGPKKDLSASPEKVENVRKGDHHPSHPVHRELFSAVAKVGVEEKVRKDRKCKQWWLSALDLGVAPDKLEKLELRLSGLPRLEDPVREGAEDLLSRQPADI